MRSEINGYRQAFAGTINSKRVENHAIRPRRSAINKPLIASNGHKLGRYGSRTLPPDPATPSSPAFVSPQNTRPEQPNYRQRKLMRGLFSRPSLIKSLILRPRQTQAFACFEKSLPPPCVLFHDRRQAARHQPGNRAGRCRVMMNFLAFLGSIDIRPKGQPNLLASKGRFVPWPVPFVKPDLDENLTKINDNKI